MVTLTSVPIFQRVANALISYARYLGKAIWPGDLSVFYPYVRAWPAWEVALAGLMLSAVTLLVVWGCRKRGYLAVGWFWFIGTLVPVIGLVQVGAQSMADRYTYIPLIGVFVVIAWGAADLARQGRRRRTALTVSSTAAIGACVVLTVFQVRLWKDTVILFEHALAVTSGSPTIHFNLAYGLLAKGRSEEALAHFSAGLQGDPRCDWIYAEIGNILMRQGKINEAITNYQSGLQVKPASPELNHCLGAAWQRQRNFSEAVHCYSRALELKPGYLEAHLNLGNTLLALGKIDDAVVQFAEAVRLSPNSAAAQWSLGDGLLRQGKPQLAVTNLLTALRVQPDYPEAHVSLAMAFDRQGNHAEAIAQVNQAIQLRPNEAEFHFLLGTLLAADKRTVEALAQYYESVRLKPDSISALNNLAWIRATHDDPAIRNGAEAVR